MENKILFKKIPNKLIEFFGLYKNNFKDKNIEMLLNTFLFLYMYSSAFNNIITNVENISLFYEKTSDKRYSKINDYIFCLKLLNSDIEINDKIVSSKIIDINTLIKNTKDYKNLMNITIEINNQTIKDNYTILYYDEYEFLLYIVDEYKNKYNKKINISCLINIYLILKMHISKNNNLEKNSSFSYTFLEEKMGYTNKTISNYLNILQEYKLIKITSGNYKERIKNVYILSNDWRIKK